MMHGTLLESVNWQQAGVFFSGMVAILGGQAGIERLLVAWRGRRESAQGTQPAAPVNGNRPVPQMLCELRHREMERREKERYEQLEKRDMERHMVNVAALSDIKHSIERLENRIEASNHRG